YVKLKVMDTFVTARPSLWWLLPALAIAALFDRRTRGLAAALLAGAIPSTLLVSRHGAARFQNFRYYMPPLALLILASTLGVDAPPRARLGGPRVLRWTGIVTALAAIALALPRVPPQIAFFRDASQNVHNQQIEVGRRRAARMPQGARVLVGDAGAIPYV